MSRPSSPATDALDAEIAKYDWSDLKSFRGDASSLPNAMRALATAGSEEQARLAYWRIDNVALVKGRLSECAAPVVSCLVACLPEVTGSGRFYLLDLLGTIAGGYDDHVDIDSVGPASVADCVRRMASRFSLYVDELRSTGNPSCVDILLMCGVYDKDLRSRVAQVFNDALELDSCRAIRATIEASLADLYEDSEE